MQPQILVLYAFASLRLLYAGFHGSCEVPKYLINAGSERGDEWIPSQIFPHSPTFFMIRSKLLYYDGRETNNTQGELGLNFLADGEPRRGTDYEGDLTVGEEASVVLEGLMHEEEREVETSAQPSCLCTRIFAPEIFP